MGCGASKQEASTGTTGKATPRESVPVVLAKETAKPPAPAKPPTPNGATQAEKKEFKVDLDATLKDPKDMSFEDGLKCLQDVTACLEPGVASHRQKKVIAFFDNSRQAMKVIANCTLPPPGGQVVIAVVELAHCAIQAIFNNENCCQLAKKMADVVYSVWRHNRVLEEENTLQLALGRLKETQSRVLEYVKHFSTKGFLQRALQYSGDQWKFTELDTEVNEVVTLLQTNLQLNTFGDVKRLSAMMGKYVNKDQELMEELKGLGGADALTDPAKGEQLKQFMEKLRPGDNLVMARLDRESRLAEAARNKGPHRRIPEPEMQLLWKESVGAAESVEWDYFFDMFPSDLPTLPETEKSKLMTVMSDERNQQAFRTVVDCDSHPTAISVMEMKKAFPKDAGPSGLVTRVQELVNKGLEKLLEVAAVGVTVSEGSKLPPCKLCYDGDKLYGRDKEVQKLKEALRDGRPTLVVVVGGPGMGATLLANTVADEMYREGRLKGGAFNVNLSGCVSMEKVADSIMMALDGQMASRGDEALRVSLARVRERGAPALMILDHCDEVLAVNKAQLETLLRLMQLDLAPNLSIILCAKKDVTFNVNVQRPKAVELQLLPRSDSIQLLKDMTEERVTQEDADEFAKKCGNHPLLLRLVGARLQKAFSCKLQRSKDKEIARVVQASVGDLISTADGGSLNCVASVAQALLMLEPAQRPRAVLLSLFPATFDMDKVQRLLSLKTPLNEDQTVDLMEMMADSCLATQENSGYSLSEEDDLLRLQPLVKGAMRNMLKDEAKCKELGLQPEDVPLYRKHFVTMTVEYVMNQTIAYMESPKTSYNALMQCVDDVAELLRLPDSDPAMVDNELDTFVRLVLLLPYVDVYEKAMVRAGCAALGKVCAKVADVWSEAACTAVAALYRDGNNAAWDVALDQVTKMQAKLRAPTTPAQQLILALLKRAEGLILRDLYKVPESVAAFESALAIGETAFDSSETARMDRIINLAELTGTLDYIGEDKMEEGLLYGKQAVSAAEELLGKNCEHPLLALCLTAQGYFYKMAKNHDAAVEVHERAGAMRQKVFGDSHIELAVSLNQQALSLAKLKRYEKANKCNERSLEMRIKCVGPNTLLVSNTYQNIGDIMREQPGDTCAARAEAAYREALKIRLRSLKPEHKKLKETRDALVSLLNEQGNQAEASRIAVVQMQDADKV